MKDLKFSCFCDVFFGELGSWWNWHKNINHLPKNIWEQNCLAFKQSVHALMNLGTSQGYTKEQVFDLVLSKVDDNCWFKRENVNLVELKREFFS